jgi:hypothetical protein
VLMTRFLRIRVLSRSGWRRGSLVLVIGASRSPAF